MARRRGQGEGSLEELPSGKWRAIYTNGKKADGSQRKVTATFETRKEAASWLNEQLDWRRKGRLCEPSRMLLSVFIKGWLKTLGARVANGTKTFCEKRVKLLCEELGDAELGQLTPLLIEQMIGRLHETGTSPDAIHKIMRVLRQALNAAVKMKLIYENPAKNVEAPKARPKEYTCWTLEDARKFLDVTRGHRYYSLFALALDTGMRQGELLGLQWADVSGARSNCSIFVRYSLEEIDGEFNLKETKTAKSRRRIWVSPETIKALGQPRGGYVFKNIRGARIAKRRLCKTFAKLVKKAGVPKIRFHDLRHTCATLLLQAGVGIKTVSERLGHASVDITLRTYAHVLPGEQEAVAKVTSKLFSPLSHEHPTDGQEQTKVQVNYFGRMYCECGACGDCVSTGLLS